jgi:hypothetical protein
MLLTAGCIGRSVTVGSGDIESESRSVSAFRVIDLRTVGNLVVEIGDDESLRIEAEDNIIDKIMTTVDDNSLIIETEEDENILPTESINYYVTARNLDELIVSGLGDFELPELNADDFKVTISGGGNIDIDELQAGRLDVNISGLGDLYIGGGKVDSQQITISGGGNHKARNMASREAAIQISGLGAATIWVEEQLDVNISGGGSVKYAGNPNVDQNISGLGDVEQIGE